MADETTMRWFTLACLALLSACVSHRPTAECTRLLTKTKVAFEHYDANKDSRISRPEFQPLIDAEIELAEREKRLHRALYDPRNFEQNFADQDKNHDGFLSFDEFTGGVCKNGHVDRPRPALPTD